MFKVSHQIFYTLCVIAILFISGCEEDDNNGCGCSANATTSTGFDSTFVAPVDTISVVAGETGAIAPGSSVQFISPYTWQNASYSWSPSASLSCSTCHNPIASPAESTIYELTVTDTSGASHTFTSLIAIYGTDTFPTLSIYIPNIFTPNGDGINDEFHVYGSAITKLNLKIKDGGSLVFETDDQNEGWDGTVNGIVPECSNFNYIVDVTFSTGHTYHAEGAVTAYAGTTVCPANIPNCRFGSQYDGSGFNPSLSSGETFPC